MKIVACNANRPLAEAVAATLKLPLTRASIRRFADMEVFVEILENVRGEDVFVVQPTSYPANDNLMELLITLDALRRSSARRVTAVIPYFGYARQDRKTASRSPISAKLVANLITEAGANRVLTMDLHAAQIQGFFDIPVDNLYAAPLFSRDIQERFKGRDLMIVSPDVGGVLRARLLATRLNCDLAIIDKRRERAGHSEVMNVIGDVEGRDCILVDDLVDSGGNSLQRGGGADQGRCALHQRLCDAWRAVWRGGGTDRVVTDRDDGDHRFDPGDRGGAAGTQRPADHHRTADGGGYAKDFRREFGEFAVRLSATTRGGLQWGGLATGCWSRHSLHCCTPKLALHGIGMSRITAHRPGTPIPRRRQHDRIMPLEHTTQRTRTATQPRITRSGRSLTTGRSCSSMLVTVDRIPVRSAYREAWRRPSRWQRRRNCAAHWKQPGATALP